MTTNFFQHIASLGVTGTFKMAITLTADGNLTVSEIFSAPCGDKAVKHIKPLTLSGTAGEIDEAFFQQITEPAQKIAGLITNMDGHLLSVEAAKAASKMVQDTKVAATKATTAAKPADVELPDAKVEKKKAYEQTMKNIAELNGNCKYEEALAQLPNATEYPDKTAEIEKLRRELERKRDQLKQIQLL